MRIVVVGGTGTIGRAVVERLRTDHEVVAVGHSSGEVQVDLSDPGSIQALFQGVGEEGDATGAVIRAGG